MSLDRVGSSGGTDSSSDYLSAASESLPDVDRRQQREPKNLGGPSCDLNQGVAEATQPPVRAQGRLLPTAPSRPQTDNQHRLLQQVAERQRQRSQEGQPRQEGRSRAHRFGAGEARPPRTGTGGPRWQSGHEGTASGLRLPIRGAMGASPMVAHFPGLSSPLLVPFMHPSFYQSSSTYYELAVSQELQRASSEVSRLSCERMANLVGLSQLNQSLARLLLDQHFQSYQNMLGFLDPLQAETWAFQNLTRRAGNPRAYLTRLAMKFNNTGLTWPRDIIDTFNSPAGLTSGLLTCYEHLRIQARSPPDNDSTDRVTWIYVCATIQLQQAIDAQQQPPPQHVPRHWIPRPANPQIFMGSGLVAQQIRPGPEHPFTQAFQALTPVQQHRELHVGMLPRSILPDRQRPQPRLSQQAPPMRMTQSSQSPLNAWAHQVQASHESQSPPGRPETAMSGITIPEGQNSLARPPPPISVPRSQQR